MTRPGKELSECDPSGGALSSIPSICTPTPETELPLFLSSPGNVSEGWQEHHRPRVCLWNSCFVTYAVTPSRFQYTTHELTITHLFTPKNTKEKCYYIFPKRLTNF